MGLIVDTFRCRDDNYGYLAHDEASGRTAAIDAPEAAAIIRAADARGWRVDEVLITHHHADHTDGILELKQRFGAVVTGPAAEEDKIAGLDRTVSAGDKAVLGGTSFAVLATPGHTLGHIVFHDAGGKAVFTGDALFSMGCGRMFEGTPGPMWDGLAQFLTMDPETLVYCGHEYTRTNGRFALSIEPDNAALKARMAEVEAQLAGGRHTVPVTLATEFATNPFLRAGLPHMAVAAGVRAGAAPSDVFAALRKAKDSFR